MTNKDSLTSNIIEFPSRTIRDPEMENKPTAIQRASIHEELRRRKFAQKIRKAMDTTSLMSDGQRIQLAQNLHKLVYELKAKRGLDPKSVANQIFGKAEIRKLQDYLLSPNAPPRARSLAGKPKKYMEIAIAAAELSSTSEEQALLDLANGTKFWPEKIEADEPEVQAAREILVALNAIPEALDKIYPLKRYFEITDRYERQPIDLAHDEDRMSTNEETAGGWHHISSPGVVIATSLIEIHDADLIVGKNRDEISQKMISGEGHIQAKVREQNVFSLAVAPIAGTPRVVGMFTKELALENGPYGRIEKQWYDAGIGPGWRPVTKMTDHAGSPLHASWRLSDLEDTRGLDPEDSWANETMPQVEIVMIDEAFLLKNHGNWSRARGLTRSNPPKWNEDIYTPHSRIGKTNSLGPLIESALLTQKESDGPITDIVEQYRRYSRTLDKWLTTLHDNIATKLNNVREQFTDVNIDENHTPVR